jgi:hypothetical protein
MRHSALVFYREQAIAHSLGAHARSGGQARTASLLLDESSTVCSRDRRGLRQALAIEVTCEESRMHLGLETQRHWSDLAIERSTPALVGLYSLVTLLWHALHPDGTIPIQQAAWYPKTQVTFSDILATVRRHL